WDTGTAGAEAEAESNAGAGGWDTGTAGAEAEAESNAGAGGWDTGTAGAEAEAKVLAATKSFSGAPAEASASVSVKVYVDTRGRYSAELWTREAKTGELIKCGSLSGAGKAVTYKKVKYALDDRGTVSRHSSDRKEDVRKLTDNEVKSASNGRIEARARANGSAVVPGASNKQITAVPSGSVAAGLEQPSGGGRGGLIGVGAGAAAASAAGLGFVLKRRGRAGVQG
ncbi:hypothetical protein ABZ070_36775, partial [Streptomyces sp. NPDC006283]